MRHKYEMRGIVLGRTPLGETSALITLITSELGLVRARAQSVRKSGAKLACALTTFSESEVVLVRGKEQWRISGAVLVESWCARLNDAHRRARAARVARLLLRLVAGEEQHTRLLYAVMRDFFTALVTLPEEIHETAEIFAVLHIIRILGLDRGEAPGDEFTESVLALIARDRKSIIMRINEGIAASGL